VRLNVLGSELLVLGFQSIELRTLPYHARFKLRTQHTELRTGFIPQVSPIPPIPILSPLFLDPLVEFSG
jgi:hypothetical protein